MKYFLSPTLFSFPYFSFLFSTFPFLSTEPSSLRASPITSLNFYTVWRMNSCIYLLPIYIFKYTFQQTLYHFSISFKYYFFIPFLIFIYSFFNISLCIPNYYIFLIANDYIFKFPNRNILKFFNDHTFQWFFLVIIYFIYQIYISLEIYQICVIWNEFMH